MRRLLGMRFVAFLCVSQATIVAGATLSIQVTDDSGVPLPSRIHLRNAAGVAQRADNLPFWNDHFVCLGRAELQLTPGIYSYEVERGPEYRPAVGQVEVPTDTAESTIQVELQRLTDMSAKGWWSGELHVHRAVEEMPLHLRAEDLHVAAVITWWNGRNLWRDGNVPSDTTVAVDGNRFYTMMGGEDEREGGALLYFGLTAPLPLPGGMDDYPEHPSPMKFVEMARQHPKAWIDLEKPFWWDTPIWLANAQLDSLGLANNHMCRNQMYESEAWGKPRDTARLPAPLGNGAWTQEIYYHILNCGLRIPPSAGSASGVLPNPVGYNRVYVQLGPELTYDAWWQGLKAGRSFVTNGPLLICQANGQPPGHVFQASGPVDIELRGELLSNDRVVKLEVILNGRIEQTIDVQENGRFGPLTFRVNQSGWFLVRAIADHPRTFRFASTAPSYVEIGGTKHRISRKSVQFFRDWVAERSVRVPRKLSDAAQLNQVLHYHRVAEQYWQELAERSNAE